MAFPDTSENAPLIRQATIASIFVALILICAKAIAWQKTGSLSIMASMVDSLLDAAASTINFFAVSYSLRSADDDHRFGHGKAEYLAGLGQALFIGASALFIIARAIDRVLHPQPLETTSVGIAVMLFAVVLTALLVLFQRHAVKQTGSTAIKADSLHYATDLFTNLGTIGALVLAGMGWSGWDPFIGMAIALLVLYSAWQIATEALQNLMDSRLPFEIEEQVRNLALANPRVLGVHDIRTRRSGQVQMIQLHLELAGETSLEQAHRTAKEVEVAIREVLPMADLIIHQDPVITSDNRLEVPVEKI
ncbi:MAG: cation diffusion facilitator family transporter [Proteobacteria bacterium]|nr:cation diffusion facilitator family transporter [Pseudomonadota bacterium]MBU1687853.1 cation diffusion facilitator family transporter [Pseudomonadota bacterium]